MIKKTGSWKDAGVMLKTLATDFVPQLKAKLYEDGRLVVETIQGHIDRQDLPWTELSEITKQLKHDERIYYETGYLRDNIGIRKVKSSANELAYFIGASPWKTHKESGLKFSDLMIYLEYGTDKIPPRPIIRPSYEEVKTKLYKEWSEYFEKSVGRK